MACKKSTITNTSESIKVISYTRCDDNFVFNNYEIQGNETVNIWYVNGTYKTAFSNLTIDSTIEWPPVTQTPSNTATPSVTQSVTPTNTVTPSVTPKNTVTPTVTPSVTTTNTSTPTVTPTKTPTPTPSRP